MSQSGMRIVILTGMSGAGKGVVLRCLEDIGYYCIDNMLPALIPKFIDLALASDGKIMDVALVADIREQNYFQDIFPALNYLADRSLAYRIVYLDARDDVLLRRYQETRRRHPLADETEGSVKKALAEERALLEEIKGQADITLDTSDFSLPAIRAEVFKLFRLDHEKVPMTVTVVSFGFKHGPPQELDLMFDVRFLPNPYYVSRLKDRDGLDPEVRDYVCKWPETAKFMERLDGFVTDIIPYYIKEGKSYLTIGVGCTGGRHRSVIIAEELTAAIRGRFAELVHQLKHRDIAKT